MMLIVIEENMFLNPGKGRLGVDGGNLEGNSKFLNLVATVGVRNPNPTGTFRAQLPSNITLGVLGTGRNLC